MDSWSYFKNEFINLGGTVENLTCRAGNNGRGIFREGNNNKPQILCPTKLLVKTKDITLIDGNFRLKHGSNYSKETREFIENYYQKFSWGESDIKETRKFHEEMLELPQEAKAFLTENKLYSINLLECNSSQKLSLQRFINSRSVSFQNKTVLAPVWELVNHSPFASGFKTSKNGLETPFYPTGNETTEIVFAYKIRASPMSMFFHYGFASDEIFAYSLPAEIKISDKDLTIKIEGNHRGVEASDKEISLEKNILTIPALPIGSISRQLPMAFFYSIIRKHGISKSKAYSLIKELQEANLEQRRNLKKLLGANLNDTAKALAKSIDIEIQLIKSSLKITMKDYK